MAMFDDLEAWRQVPPEVKIELMARAHSKGLLATVGTVLVASTCAVALKAVWMMWLSILIAPVIFQMSASKSWRALKPAVILRYLAARSAARRYAYSAKSEDLTLDLIFTARIERIIESDNPQEILNASIDNLSDADVWITLFHDTVVVMSEKAGGAKLELAHPIDHKLSIKAEDESLGDYVSNKSLVLSILREGIEAYGEVDEEIKYRITSNYPAALVVFEKKLQELLKNKAVEELKNQKLMTPVDDVEELLSL